MEIISEPQYIEEQQDRYDIGFVGDIFSFVVKGNDQDTVSVDDNYLVVELFNPRETININYSNVLWVRKTPQTIRRRLQLPVPETPTPAIT